MEAPLRTGGVADRYAAALYAYADEQGALDRVVEEMTALGRLARESEDFRRFLISPLHGVNQARATADGVLAEQGFGEAVRHFVGVVANNRRLPDLPRIIEAFAALVAARRGVWAAQVATAHPLTETQRQQLRARLIEAGYGQVDLRESVDPGLLGGLTLRIGARLYDTSIRTRLQRMEHAMKSAR